MPAGEATVKAVLGDPEKGRVLHPEGSPLVMGPRFGGGLCPSVSMGSCSIEAAIPSGTLCGGKEKILKMKGKLPATES